MRRANLASAILLAGLLALPTAWAAASPMPIAVPAPDRAYEGFDWAARTWATHVKLDARPYASVVKLDNVTTPLLDLEIRNLMPFPRGYHLVAGTTRIPTVANATGVGIVWDVPARPAVWTLLDNVDNEPVTTIVVKGEAPAVTMRASSCPWWWPSCAPPREEEPIVVSGYYVEANLVVEQAAYSFTEFARIEIDDCWDHNIAVSGYASGGMAARAGVGGEHGYSDSSCQKFVSVGAPTIFRRENSFRRDNYEDGSFRIYTTGKTNRYDFRTEPETYFPPPSDALVVSQYSSEVVEISRKQTDSVAVWYEGGVTAFGVQLDVKFWDRGTEETRVNVLLQPGHTYKVNFLDDSDEQSGMVGMVWLADK